MCCCTTHDQFSTSVEEFTNQAADDPDVMGIKMMLYRTSKDSSIIAFRLRGRNGKQMASGVRPASGRQQHPVGQTLEFCVHVVYGVIGSRPTRRSCWWCRRKQRARYVHIGTGNYNPKTSKLYTDVGLGPPEPRPGGTVQLPHRFFSKRRASAITGGLVTLRSMEGLIRREIRHAKDMAPHPRQDELAGGSGHRCSMKPQAGVVIELIICGMCCLYPGREGISETIKVVSIIGRYLEHSRIFWFGNNGDPEIYIGSAD